MLTPLQREVHKLLSEKLSISHRHQGESRTRAFCRVLFLANQKQHLKGLAKLLPIAEGTLRRWYKDYAVKRTYHTDIQMNALRKVNARQKICRATVKTMLESNKSLTEISEFLGISYEGLRQVISKARRDDPGWIVFTCQVCDRRFIPKCTRYHYCSRECVIEAKRHRRPHYHAVERSTRHEGGVYHCTECDKAFTIGPHQGARITCSHKCAKYRLKKMRKRNEHRTENQDNDGR